MSNELSNHPLLASGELPRFADVVPAEISPAIESLLGELTEELETVEANASATWSALIEPLERMGDRLGFAWGVVGHLMGVRNSEALREVYEEIQPSVITFGLRQAQSRPIFDLLVSLREGDGWGSLSDAQQRIVQSLIRDAKHAGVGLDGAERERFNAIQNELGQRAVKFSNNVLDATRAWALTLGDVADMEGTPDSLRELAAQSEREAGDENATAEEGPWRITLDHPSFGPFMEHAASRTLREQVYRAFVTRASSGEADNSTLIEEILGLRQEEAKILGYDSFAEVSLASKMAPNVEAVKQLLEDLRVVSHPAAEKDLAELTEFASERSGERVELNPWDVAYWAERMREARFDYSEEELRPYFPLPRVLEGLFGLAERLFGVKIEAADGQAPVWHDDVRFFRVADETGAPIAAFYLDPYSRPSEKRGGAWMDECLGRSKALAPAGGDVRLPVAYLVCNQTPPVQDRPSHMSFDEVITLFHEFGHGLQHMLTRVDEGLASGIRNVEWDAVELPSQFMENFCYDRATLQGLSAHVETGESLPDALFDKLDAARTYRAGSDMLRQLYFALTDLALHGEYTPGEGETAFDVQRQVAEKTTVIEPLPEDRFLCSFGHIFAGGYAAGYYSYKWAEVLSADAYSAFEEVGLDNEAAVSETGRRYRETVLALGGSRSPSDVFEAFRGRPPSPEALLRHAGLLVS